MVKVEAIACDEVAGADPDCHTAADPFSGAKVAAK